MHRIPKHATRYCWILHMHLSAWTSRWWVAQIHLQAHCSTQNGYVCGNHPEVFGIVAMVNFWVPNQSVACSVSICVSPQRRSDISIKKTAHWLHPQTVHIYVIYFTSDLCNEAHLLLSVYNLTPVSSALLCLIAMETQLRLQGCSSSEENVKKVMVTEQRRLTGWRVRI